MLAEHPEISPARPKEPGFFAFEDIHAKGFDWYHSLFDFDPKRHAYRLEASTDYTKAPFVDGVWARMKARRNARYKLIYIMRHPLRRLESHARHVQIARKELGQIVSPAHHHSLEHGLSLPSLAMTEYARQIDIYSEARTAGNLYLTTLEELKAEPSRIMAEIYAFLNLPALPDTNTALRKNAAKATPRTVRRSWEKLSTNTTLISASKLILGKSVRERIKTLFVREIEVTGRYRFTPEEEIAIMYLLKGDLERLQNLYDGDLKRIWDLGRFRELFESRSGGGDTLTATGNRV